MKLTYRCSNLLIVALLLGVLCAAMPRGGDSLLSRAQAQDGAQDWPLKPIHAIVPFTAGSATDIVARTVFEPLSHELGQSIIVENRAGAGGMIGAGMVAKADPDGYSLLVSSSSHTIIPALYPKVPYDTVQDFTGVIPLGSLPNVLVVSPSKGFHTVNDLVAAAKARPGMMTYASAGIGSATHFAVERFRLSAGLEGVHVPFRGTPEASTEVMTGRVDFFLGPLASLLPLIRDGKLVALAVSTPKRAAALPDVPTTLEAGFANSDYTFWVAIFARAKTPGPIVERLHNVTRKILEGASLHDKLTGLGVDPMDMEPADLDTLVRTEIAINTPLVRAAHIQAN
jgi:tripartite-type tricarboxylate transporter receptor subunit TctC